MNAVLATPPSVFQPHHTRYSPTRSMSYSINSTAGKKRKPEDEEPQSDERMSASPSPNIPSRALNPQRQIKRPRTGLIGRPLALPRLLETLDADSLRGVLQTICSRNPTIGAEVENTAPRPSVDSALAVLKKYESTLQDSFPFGGDPTSDYAYNRVRQALLNLLEALADFTPHFLPPNETQATQSLSFLDGATDIIHRLPNWSSFQNTIHKQNAYDEISRAWTLAIREAAKRAGGMQLQYGGWDHKIMKHNQQANGKLQEAVNELNTCMSWMGGHQQPSNRGDDVSSVRQELLSGTYGSNYPVRVGPW